MDCDWFVHYLRLDSDRSYHCGLFAETHEKKQGKCGHVSRQATTSHAALEFSVLSFGNTHEHVVPHSLLRSTVCQVMSAFVS